MYHHILLYPSEAYNAYLYSHDVCDITKRAKINVRTDGAVSRGQASRIQESWVRIPQLPSGAGIMVIDISK